MYKPRDVDKKALQRSIDEMKRSEKERQKAIESQQPKSKVIRRGLSDTRRKKLSIRNRRRNNK